MVERKVNLVPLVLLAGLLLAGCGREGVSVRQKDTNVIPAHDAKDFRVREPVVDGVRYRCFENLGSYGNGSLWCERLS